MNPDFQKISYMLSKAIIEISAQIYIDALNRYQKPARDSDITPIIEIPLHTVTQLIDFFNRTNFNQQYSLQKNSAQERGSIISLFSVFGALRGINVLILATRENFERETLCAYFRLNPFVTQSTNDFISIQQSEERMFPRNIEIAISTTFRASYGKGLLICSGDLNREVVLEGRRSLNHTPNLTLTLTKRIPPLIMGNQTIIV